MKALYNFTIITKIRLGQWLSLIFFACLFALGCKPKEANIAIVWNEKQAKRLSISGNFFQDDIDSAIKYLQVRLAVTTTPMLGSLAVANNRIVFTPVIPLMRGGEYEVYYKTTLIGQIKIPPADTGDAAFVVHIFPATDTVPENLLKMYIQFSAPMQEGQAMKYIYLLNEQNDTIPNIFLDLQPELWDEKRMTLTVWLDPGRIKRELMPNLKMGNPLESGERYTVAVSNKWKDAQGLTLRQSFTQKFTSGTRDSTSPDPDKWKINLPQANTKQALQINFGEALDYYLLQETMVIKNVQGNTIKGKMSIPDNATGYTLSPDEPWLPGRYRLQVATLLEDLAGNNINRLFERDLKTQKNKLATDFFEKDFIIE